MTPDATSTAPPFEIRPLCHEKDYEQCLDLQVEVWGDALGEVVSPALLRATQETGGVVEGAFDGDHLLGFVFGMPGLRDGVLVHWSHLLAVREDRRGRGIGQQLKQHQRQRVRDMGIGLMYWTYDPLVARNAHVNLNRLGAEVVEYIRSMYGVRSLSKADSGIGSDRLLVRWNIDHPKPTPGTPPPDWEHAPVVTAYLGPAGPAPVAEPDLVDTPAVRVEIPADIQVLKHEAPTIAAAWRTTTRRALEHYLERDYRARAVVRDHGRSRTFYILTRE